LSRVIEIKFAPEDSLDLAGFARTASEREFPNIRLISPNPDFVAIAASGYPDPKNNSCTLNRLFLGDYYQTNHVIRYLGITRDGLNAKYSMVLNFETFGRIITFNLSMQVGNR
jgi:hypothetical protein